MQTAAKCPGDQAQDLAHRGVSIPLSKHMQAPAFRCGLLWEGGTGGSPWPGPAGQCPVLKAPSGSVLTSQMTLTYTPGTHRVKK